jgi:hypothetical protein
MRGTDEQVSAVMQMAIVLTMSVILYPTRFRLGGASLEKEVDDHYFSWDK